jgi:hypothetical protein
MVTRQLISDSRFQIPRFLISDLGSEALRVFGIWNQIWNRNQYFILLENARLELPESAFRSGVYGYMLRISMAGCNGKRV